MTKTGKIVHVTTVHRPFDIRIFQKECRTLAAAGYEVVLIARHEQDEVVDGVRVAALHSNPKNRFERMFFTSWQAWKACRAEDALLYHFHDPELLPLAQLLRISGKKVVYDMHENLAKQVLSKGWIPSIFRKAVSLLTGIGLRILLKGIPVVFAEESYLRYHSWLKDHVTVLNMPILDILEAIEEPKHTTPTVGYIGAVGAGRGANITLEALRVLNEKGKTVHFECVGPFAYEHTRESLVRLVDEYGLSGVQFYGYLLPDKAWPIIARCHIGLALLLPMPSHLEIYPTKIFEYMALGMPVVASNFPDYKKIIEDAQCGITVNPEDEVEIASAIEWLLEHPQEAELMGTRGKEATSDRYNWRIEAAKLLNFYEKILD